MPFDLSAGRSGRTLMPELDLLERAVAYTRLSLQLVAPDLLHAPTPCEEWDLVTLLGHMDDSLAALADAADVGYVAIRPLPRPDPANAVTSIKARACALLAAWTAGGGADLVSVAGCPLSARVLVSTGALEITTHGWDVARACGVDRQIPGALAQVLLRMLPDLVHDSDRVTRFAHPVDVPPWWSPSDQLVAALGRQPVWSAHSRPV
jgi:uncharacterized protein (TIGR03086 family)